MRKLSPGTLIVGIFAVLFGLAGAYAAKQYLHEQPAPAAVEEVMRQTVPLASNDLIPGRTLTLGDVMLVKMTREQLAERGLPKEFMTNPSQVIGRMLRKPADKGQAFTTTMFYPEGFGPGVAERLEPGYRAVSVSLEEGAPGLPLVAPGMNVDVVFRWEANPTEQVPEATVTLLEGVEVLAIGEETFQGTRAPGSRKGAGRKAPAVTLAVTPEQASALKVVEGHGSMSLVARGPGDEEPGSLRQPQTLAGLLDLPRPEAPFTTQIYRRGRLTTNIFENGRQTVIAEASDRLPIAADGLQPTVRTVSHSVAKTTTKEKPSSCGCKAN